MTTELLIRRNGHIAHRRSRQSISNMKTHRTQKARSGEYTDLFSLRSLIHEDHRQLPLESGRAELRRNGL